ncbi:MAG: hypothetical protein A2138_17800 [Deltaproteobacteria bacterium RBG_16_71_12]|nr:MAG: hypothetical protein A2138_17800 [Deltaproteobacteria bacterium RBG_16_71_12]
MQQLVVIVLAIALATPAAAGAGWGPVVDYSPYLHSPFEVGPVPRTRATLLGINKGGGIISLDEQLSLTVLVYLLGCPLEAGKASLSANECPATNDWLYGGSQRRQFFTMHGGALFPLGPLVVGAGGRIEPYSTIAAPQLDFVGVRTVHGLTPRGTLVLGPTAYVGAGDEGIAVLLCLDVQPTLDWEDHPLGPEHNVLLNYMGVSAGATLIGVAVEDIGGVHLTVGWRTLFLAEHYGGAVVHSLELTLGLLIGPELIKEIG